MYKEEEEKKGRKHPTLVEGANRSELMLMTRHTPQSWWRILTDYLYSCCGSI
jgi:hypothetical protein